MVADLSGIRAKIKRAEEHIAEVQAMVAVIRDSHSGGMSREFNSETKHHIIRFRGPVPVAPHRFRVVVGEAIQQLRSSLDHLVCQLVIHESELHGISEADVEYRQFPIFRKPNQPKFKRMVRGVCGGAKAAIERLQPYHFQGSPEEHFLYSLADLNNRDKHRLLLVVAFALVKQGVSVGGRGFQQFMSMSYGPKVIALKDGAVLWEHIGDAEVQVNPKISLDIAFPQIGLSKLEPVVPCLEQLRQCVITIVDDFEARFF